MTSAAVASGGQPGRSGPRPLTAAALGLPDVARTAGPQDGLATHVRATLDAGLRVLLAEQATAGLAEEPESVHQMRVACRRMRVALKLDRGIGTGGGELRSELSWLAGLLGQVRDLDVLTERLAEDGAGLPESDLPAFAEVLSALLAARATAAGLLAKALTRQRYRALLHRLAAEATAVDPDAGAEPIDPDALLVRPVRALHLQLTAAARSPSDAAWHALRIRVKRVRYAAEVAGRLAGPKRRAALRELTDTAKAAQEWLGAFQDTVVTEHHLRQLVTAHPTELSAPAVLVTGRLVERQVRKRDELRERLPAACGDLYRATRRPS